MDDTREGGFPMDRAVGDHDGLASEKLLADVAYLAWKLDGYLTPREVKDEVSDRFGETTELGSRDALSYLEEEGLVEETGSDWLYRIGDSEDLRGCDGSLDAFLAVGEAQEEYRRAPEELSSTQQELLDDLKKSGMVEVEDPRYVDF